MSFLFRLANKGGVYGNHIMINMCQDLTQHNNLFSMIFIRQYISFYCSKPYINATNLKDSGGYTKTYNNVQNHERDYLYYESWRDTKVHIMDMWRSVDHIACACGPIKEFTGRKDDDDKCFLFCFGEFRLVKGNMYIE